MQKCIRQEKPETYDADAYRAAPMAEPFGSLLRRLIASSGMLQSEFAERVGASPQFISNVVNGDRSPDAQALVTWAALLNLDGERLAAFIEAGRSAKAAGIKSVASYVLELEADVEQLEARLTRMQTAFKALVALSEKQGGKLPKGFLQRFGPEASAEDADSE